MKFIQIDSGGLCLNNMERIKTWEDIEMALSEYKFYLAFENSECDDYVTEKYWRTLKTGAVPVVMGAPNIDTFAPAQNSVINVADFSTPRRLAEYLLFIAANDTLFNEMNYWRGKDKSTLNPDFTNLFDKPHGVDSCYAVQALVQAKQKLESTGVPTTSFDNSCLDPSSPVLPVVVSFAFDSNIDSIQNTFASVRRWNPELKLVTIIMDDSTIRRISTWTRVSMYRIGNFSANNSVMQLSIIEEAIRIFRAVVWLAPGIEITGRLDEVIGEIMKEGEYIPAGIMRPSLFGVTAGSSLHTQIIMPALSACTQHTSMCRKLPLSGDLSVVLNLIFPVVSSNIHVLPAEQTSSLHLLQNINENWQLSSSGRPIEYTIQLP